MTDEEIQATADRINAGIDELEKQFAIAGDLLRQASIRLRYYSAERDRDLADRIQDFLLRF
jgi:hypothetical protein